MEDKMTEWHEVEIRERFLTDLPVASIMVWQTTQGGATALSGFQLFQRDRRDAHFAANFACGGI